MPDLSSQQFFGSDVHRACRFIGKLTSN